MDCTSAQDHIAAWLDDELSVSARTLFERHLGTCVECRALADSLAAQELAPPEGLFEDRPVAFWDTLDAALDQEWERQLRTPPVSATAPPWYRRSISLPLPAVLAYAALSLLMVGWMAGGAPGLDLTASTGPAPLAASDSAPSGELPGTADTGAAGGAWTVATYTPHRGTF